MTTADLRYPIGRFVPASRVTDAALQTALDDLAALPLRLREAVDGLDEAKLGTPYRPGGWTVRQVAHHLADSHLNGYVRVKLALTEDAPSIKPYDENAWAALPDSQMPVDVSLSLLDHLHARWFAVYSSMGPDEFSRTFFHPELAEHTRLEHHLQMYAWHSRHHVAHITAMRSREGW